MGETAGWSSAAADQSHLVERADGRLSYLLRSYDFPVIGLQIVSTILFLKFSGPY
jgi:hypothetical protein